VDKGSEEEEEKEEEAGGEYGEDASGGEEERASENSARAWMRLNKTEVDCRGRGRGRWGVMLGPGSSARVLELSDTRAGDHGTVNGQY